MLATDGGGLRSNLVNNVAIVFVNMSSVPYFDDTNEWTVRFTENTTGLDEIRILPEALDPKNVGVVNEEDRYEIYYFIDGEFESSLIRPRF